MKSKDKNAIKKLIVENEPLAAMELFVKVLERSEPDSEYLETLQNLMARQNKLFKDQADGVLSTEEISVRQNRINKHLLGLLKGSPLPTSPKPSLKRKSSRWLGWGIALAFLLAVLYYFIPGNTHRVLAPKLCILPDIDMMCCDQGINRFRVAEAGASLFCSLLLQPDPGDPLIKGRIYTDSGQLLQEIRLTKQNPTAICYSGSLSPPSGGHWTPGRYRIAFLVNDKPAGNMEFSIIP